MALGTRELKDQLNVLCWRKRGEILMFSESDSIGKKMSFQNHSMLAGYMKGVLDRVVLGTFSHTK